MGRQWHRVEHGQAPAGHALEASVSGKRWRTFELDDGRWQLEQVQPAAPPRVVDSLGAARQIAEGRASNPIEDMPGGSVKGCIKKMRRRGDIDDPGAYCASIADRIEPGWRSSKRNTAASQGLELPLEQDAKLTVYVGGIRDGDPVWLQLRPGHVPIEVVRKFLERIQGITRPVTLIPVRSSGTRTTFKVPGVDRTGRPDETPVDVELTMSKKRSKNAPPSRMYSDLRAGDRYTRDGVEVLVVGDPESTTDRFGRTMSRIWIRRLDTGQEGWQTFGPGGVVPGRNPARASAAARSRAPFFQTGDQIVVGWLEDGTPTVAMWQRRGSSKQLVAAHQFVERERPGGQVFTFAKSVKDPLERAREQLVARLDPVVLEDVTRWYWMTPSQRRDASSMELLDRLQAVGAVELTSSTQGGYQKRLKPHYEQAAKDELRRRGVLKNPADDSRQRRIAAKLARGGS